MNVTDSGEVDPTYPANTRCPHCLAAYGVDPPQFKTFPTSGAVGTCLRCGFQFLSHPDAEGPILYPGSKGLSDLRSQRQQHDKQWLDSPMAPEELGAGRIVEYVTGWKVECYDLGGASARPDFRIHYPSGATPLEVTRSINDTALERHRATNKHTGHPNPELRHDWAVYVATEKSKLNVKKWMDRLLPLLLELERHRIGNATAEEIGEWHDVGWMRERGLRSCHVVSDRGEGCILLAPIEPGGAFGADDIVCAVLEEARKPDIRNKLGNAGELFVWVDLTMYAALAALTASLEDFPDTLERHGYDLDSRVPSEVTSLWLAAGPHSSPSDDDHYVWRWQRGEGWKRHDTLRLRNRLRALL